MLLPVLGDGGAVFHDVLRLILLFTMTFPHLSNLTIALCYPITWTAASVMFLLYYKFGKWLPAYPQKQPDIG